jgi:hypothetical protein
VAAFVVDVTDCLNEWFRKGRGMCHVKTRFHTSLMIQILPSPQDCCRPCCQDSVIVVTVGGNKEVYSGNGDPNGQIAPVDTTQEAVYYNLDTPGETWWWQVSTQTWI